MNMTQVKELPATVRMLDRQRGDLFVVLMENVHWVVMIHEALIGATNSTGFQRGYVSLDKSGKPNLIRLAQSELSTGCRPLASVLPCEECGSVMQPKDEFFICETGKHRL